MRRKQGWCIGCGNRRALTVDMCDECERVENETQADHWYGVQMDHAAVQAFRAWRTQWQPAYEQSVDDQLRDAFMAAWSSAPMAAERIRREVENEFNTQPLRQVASTVERDRLRAALERAAGDLAETIWRGKPDRAQNEATLEIVRATLENRA